MFNKIVQSTKKNTHYIQMPYSKKTRSITTTFWLNLVKDKTYIVLSKEFSQPIYSEKYCRQRI